MSRKIRVKMVGNKKITIVSDRGIICRDPGRPPFEKNRLIPSVTDMNTKISDTEKILCQDPFMPTFSLVNQQTADKLVKTLLDIRRNAGIRKIVSNNITADISNVALNKHPLKNKVKRRKPGSK